MLRIGERVIKTSLDERYYKGVIEDVVAGEDAVFKGGITQPTVKLKCKLYLEEATAISKEKNYIATTKEGSELRSVIDELLAETDIEKGVNLEDLIGLKCEIEIIHQISKKGNRFENIGKIRFIDQD